MESLAEIRRGDLLTIAVSGDYGKPRPALVIQANAFDALPSVPREKIGKPFGRLDDATMREVSLALVGFFGLEGVLPHPKG